MERVNKMTDNKNKLYDLTYTSNNSNIIKSQTIEANSLLNLTKRINNFKELVLITDADILEIKERENITEEKEELSFICDIPVSGTLSVIVDGIDKKDAINNLKDGNYETGDDKEILPDYCELELDNISEEDLEEHY